MSWLAMTLGGAALGLALTSWAAYLATIARGTVAVRPYVTGAMHLAALALGVAALVEVARTASHLGGVAIAMASFALVLGGLFFFLLSQRKTPIGELRVAVGDTLLPFASTDADGNAFHTDQLAGQRVLLKFFRGHW